MNEIILKSLSKEFRIINLFVFGNKLSKKDIDILIVSDDFQNISRIKRKMLINKISPILDPICLTVMEFKKLKCSKSSLWRTVSSNGQRII